MILSELKDYLAKTKVSSMFELQLHFNTDAEVLRDMLEHWIRKGKIKKTKRSVKCGSCQQCNPLMTELYEWIEEEEKLE